MTKVYNAQLGIPLDGDFLSHVANGCVQCARFDAEKPPTISLMCLEGAVLWKRENAEKVSRKNEWKPDTVASKKEVAAKMKYKE